MNKLSKNLISIAGILVFVLMLSFGIPKSADAKFAQSGVLFFPTQPQYTYNTNNNRVQNNNTGPNLASSGVVQFENQTNTNNNLNNNDSSNANNSSTTSTTNNANENQVSSSSTSNTDNTTTSNSRGMDYGSLTANALVGSNSFMPSGLLQWIFALILIITIILIWRHMYGKKEYMATPMKHA